MCETANMGYDFAFKISDFIWVQLFLSTAQRDGNGWSGACFWCHRLHHLSACEDGHCFTLRICGAQIPPMRCQSLSVIKVGKLSCTEDITYLQILSFFSSRTAIFDWKAETILSSDSSPSSSERTIVVWIADVMPPAFPGSALMSPFNWTCLKEPPRGVILTRCP